MTVVVARDVLAAWNLKEDDPNNDPICITAKTETTAYGAMFTFGEVVLVILVVEGENIPRL